MTAAVEAGAPSREGSVEARAERAIEAACAHLASTQTERGSWAGDYGGPMFLLPMYVAVARFAEHALAPERREAMTRSLRRAQNADGSVGVYEGGPGCVFTSSLAYAALRLLGVAAADPSAARLAAWVRAHGTPLAAASWGKFTLALVDLYDYEGLDPLTPELWLLPYALPIHPGRLWCHARQVYLPMAYLYGRRARRPADDLVRALRDELYGPGYARIDWRAARGTVAPEDAYRPATPWLRAANLALGAYERVAPKGLRERALDETFAQIAFEDEVTSFIRIGPVNAVLNTAVHAARAPGGEAVRRSFEALKQYLWHEPERGVSMQGYNSSELWDTAFAVQSVLAAPRREAARAMLARAHTYLRDNQILDDVPEPARHYRHRSRGGWPFSNRAHGWPITDCTAEAFKCAVALEREVDRPVGEGLLADAVELLLSFQNDDGGWATYEKQRAGRWLEALNPSQVFGDIMVDTSFTECSSSVMQALAVARRRFPGRFDVRIDRAMKAGERFLRARQDPSGGWEGSWGVCFTYGTWFGVSGLLAAGASPGDPAIARACAFLRARQKADGSWGERPESCSERRYVEHAEGQVVMTSWALSTLVRARHPDRAAMARAARFLVERQRADGGWARESFAGVFNRTCMINYDNYRLYFPVWALGEWLALPPAGRAS
jgi:squalene/oxidosqualene cyclase-like protein